MCIYGKLPLSRCLDPKIVHYLNLTISIDFILEVYLMFFYVFQESINVITTLILTPGEYSCDGISGMMNTLFFIRRRIRIYTWHLSKADSHRTLVNHKQSNPSSINTSSRSNSQIPDVSTTSLISNGSTKSDLLAWTKYHYDPEDVHLHTQLSIPPTSHTCVLKGQH